MPIPTCIRSYHDRWKRPLIDVKPDGCGFPARRGKPGQDRPEAGAWRVANSLGGQPTLLLKAVEKALADW